MMLNICYCRVAHSQCKYTILNLVYEFQSRKKKHYRYSKNGQNKSKNLKPNWSEMFLRDPLKVHLCDSPENLQK